MNNDYNSTIKYISLLLTDTNLLQSVIKLDNIEGMIKDSVQWSWMITTIRDYFNKYNTPPTIHVLRQETLNLVFDDITKLSIDKFIDRIEQELNNPDTDKQYTIDSLKDNIRRIRIQNQLLTFADRFKDQDIDSIEKELGLSNPFKINTNEESPDSKPYNPYDYIQHYIEDITRKTSLINNGFFSRKETICLVAGYGEGKSVLVNQFGIGWGSGKDCLGWTPNGKLKVLIIQCEDYGLKNQRMMRSICSRYDRHDNCKIIPYRFSSYKQLDIELRKECKEFNPDIIIINPLFRYILSNKSLKDDNTINEFLSTIESISSDFNCGVIVVHHLKKDGSSDYGSALLGWAFRSITYIEKVKPRHYFFRVDKRESESGGIHGTNIKWSDNKDDYFWVMSDSKDNNDDDTNKVLESIVSDTRHKELVQRTGFYGTKVTRILFDLISKGQVTKNDDGTYTRIKE